MPRRGGCSRPGGLLAAWCYGNPALPDPALDRVLAHFIDGVVGPYWPPERRLILEGYASIPFPFREIPAPPLSLEADLDLEGLAGYLRTWSATSRYVAAHGGDPVAGVVEALRPGWGDPASPRRVRWPLAMRAGYTEAE